MAVKYTVAINHGECMEGLYETWEQATERAVALTMGDYFTKEEVKGLSSEDILERADGYYDVKEISI